MRELKFRLIKKRKIIGYMELASFKPKYTFTRDFETTKTYKPEVYDEKNQFTSLKDKNGKEIYEGDIVHYTNWRTSSTEDGTEYYVIIVIGEIVYDVDLAKFRIKDDNTELGDDEHLEVIGNIYEHKELLE